uniref:Uncharacterized protein n=1 Tax=Anthoceros angustus TaxID=48387 RepID=A0A2P1L4W2_ANTAG|nr:hypothetical protein AnanMp20 [Anthoceros angustus]AVP12850.1 hypothetical protein AnanMp20 [Anthoceros angustus]
MKESSEEHFVILYPLCKIKSSRNSWNTEVGQSGSQLNNPLLLVRKKDSDLLNNCLVLRSNTPFSRRMYLSSSKVGCPYSASLCRIKSAMPLMVIKGTGIPANLKIWRMSVIISSVSNRT